MLLPGIEARLYKVTPLPKTKPCKHCGGTEGYIVPAEMHIGLYCVDCDSWQKWVAKQEAERIAIEGDTIVKEALIADEAYQPPLLPDEKEQVA